ncbi:MAG TPA: protein kinase [Vicinamibacterales bacterium]|nr:protein kinase [Vicinamibacterales bacterium]
MATIAGRYEIAATIGQGGMGVVFRAFDSSALKRDVAVKTLNESDAAALDMFYKECSALKSISHPNIVEIFDMGEYEEGGKRKPFFVMPLLQGQTLEELIASSRHHLTVGRVIEIIAQTCKGLQAAHDHGLIHRDLKPSNIFVMRDDSVKIIDFGIAYAISAESRTRGFRKGTLPYMAPEQVDLRPASVQSDIYSLGVTLYEALTRTRAFRGSTEDEVIKAIRTQMPPPVSEINPMVSHLMSRVVHKAMAKQPWNRYDSAREFGQTVQRAGRGEPIELFDPSRTQPRMQTARRALERGDHQFALDIVNELEAEGTIDGELTLLRSEIERVVQQKTIGQLFESARARVEEGEDLLALTKLHELLQLDPTNLAALALKSRIEDRRGEIQMNKWIQLARQHMDHHAYGQAREALQGALVLRPKDPGVGRLLKEIENAEQEYLRLSKEKEELYQAARRAWQSGEVSQALSRMRAVLDLESKAPDTVTSSTYQTFYEKLHAEHDAINNASAEARRHLADKRFDEALKICEDFLTRFPGQPSFRLLKSDIEEQQRQQRSAYIAEIDARLKHEADLDTKVSLLREALSQYPDEDHFKVRLRALEDRRDYYRATLERARTHEANGDFAAALADLDALDAMQGAFPGLSLERERLRKHVEHQRRQLAFAAWTRKIDAQLESSNYTRAGDLVNSALVEFPDNADLNARQKQAAAGRDRTRRADELVAGGRQLCAAGQFERGVELLRAAQQLDDRTSTRQVLRDVFVARAQEFLSRDWRTALSFSEQALEIDPNHALAQNLRAGALDRKADEEISRCIAEANTLQAAGDIAGAHAKLREGLASYRANPRLIAVVDALPKEVQPPPQQRSEPAPPPPAPPPTPDAPLTREPHADGLRNYFEAERADSLIERIRSRPILLLASAVGIVLVSAVTMFLFTGQRSPERQPSRSTIPPNPPPPARPVRATLALQGLPSGLQVALDGTPVGSVDPAGALVYTDVSPGRHTVVFTLPDYEPFKIETDFTAGNTVTLSNTDVPLPPVTGAIQFIANQGTVITVSQPGRTPQQVYGSGRVSLTPGTYDVVAKGPAGVESKQRQRVTAGGNQVLDFRELVVTGMERFDRTSWDEEKGWFTRRGGGVILYEQPTPNGRFTFTVGRSPNNLFSGDTRLKWFVGYVDGSTFVRFELDRRTLNRADVVGGRMLTMMQSPHRIPNNAQFVYLNIQISGNRLIQQYSLDGQNWNVLDDWTRTVAATNEPRKRTALEGRFGLMVQSDEIVSLSNLLFYPAAPGSPTRR